MFTEPLLVQKMSAQMGYLSQRQSVLAANIANVDTPNYRAQDLKKLNFDDLASAASNHLEMRTTSAKDIPSPLHKGDWQSEKLRQFVESKPGGNNVVLEEQLGKVSDTGAQHQLTSSLYKKYNQLYATALDNHGG